MPDVTHVQALLIRKGADHYLQTWTPTPLSLTIQFVHVFD